MPLHFYRCEKCFFTKEYFVNTSSATDKQCPNCSSDQFKKRLSRTLMNVEYANNNDYMERKIQPMVDETFSQIGKEALAQDSKTLENIYGKEQVENTFYQEDD